MLSLTAFVLVYVLGGITFIPLVVAALVGLLYYASPTATVTDVIKNRDGQMRVGLDEPAVSLQKKDSVNTRIYRSGWLNVRRTFEAIPDPWLASNGTNASEGSYMTSIASSYRSFMDSRSKDPKKSRPKDRLFAVLKDSVLFLYENEQESECWAAIKITLHDVLIYPENLIDGELFMKRNAICLRPHLLAGLSSSSSNTSINGELPSLIMTQQMPAINGTSIHGSEPSDSSSSHQPWFLFPAINHDKEDWYHSLVQSSRLTEPSELTKDATLFDADDMGRLVEAIDEQPDPIPTRWLNAMLGRLFFSVYRTSAVEEYIVRKLMRKLSKVNKPSFLSEIEVKEVNVGATTPFFSKPMLKELTAEGDASMEMQVKYVGDFRITIATVATLNLGTRFKSYSVRLVLAVILKELEGTLLLKIKRPPSNRLWFSFTTMPRLVLAIEPVVSTRQIKWNLITKPIESRLREIVLESIVMPHMDDVAFLNTKPYSHRGGIFADCARKAADLGDDTGPSASTVHTDDGSLDEEEDPETGNIAPGLPNFKLGDDRSESLGSESASAAANMRQRPAHARKLSDDGASVKSSQSVPILEESKKEKDIHARKKSWFGAATSSSASSTSPSKSGRLQATESDTSLSLESNTSKGSPISLSPESARQSVSRNRAPSTPESVHGDSTEGAAERLREILESGKKGKSSSGSSSDEITKSTTVHGSEEAPVAPVERTASAPLLTTSPTHSASSGLKAPFGTSLAAHTPLQSPAPIPVPELSKESNETESSLPASLYRAKSDKSITSIQTNSSGSSINASSMSSGAFPTPASSVASTSTIPTSGSSTILNNWRAKAADKQALQASVDRGVLQAKDAMNKWSSKWQAYRKQQPTERSEGYEDVLGTVEHPESRSSVAIVEAETEATAATPLLGGKATGSPPAVTMSKSSSQSSIGSPISIGSKFDEHPESKSRTESMASTSPRHFKPHAPTTTTSLTTGDSVAMVPSPSSSPNISSRSSSNMKRVPPQSTVPVHPAFSNNNQSRSAAVPSKPPGTSEKSGYKKATMMAIPGIDDSRRYAVSSEDFRNVNDSSSKGPALPARPSDSSPASKDALDKAKPADIIPLALSLPEGTALSQPVPTLADAVLPVPDVSEEAENITVPPLPVRHRSPIESSAHIPVPSLSVEPAAPSVA